MGFYSKIILFILLGLSSLPLLSFGLKNENCANCTLSAAETLEDPGSLYDRIRSKYMSSGNCHRYSYLPEKEQVALKLSQYSRELRSFSLFPPSLSEGTALSTLISDLGISAPDASLLRKEWASLPKLSANPSQERSVFQLHLIRLIKPLLNQEPARSHIQARLNGNFRKMGITDDCDFISRGAFIEAYLAKKRHGDENLNKPSLLTILDRSLPRTGRRLITLDLNQETVLFHSTAGFGDADGNGMTLKEEANQCSNRSESNASPYGLAITTTTRKASSKNGFPGLGTILKTPSDSGLTERGIAIHSGGLSGMDRYFRRSKSSDLASPGTALETALLGGEKPGASLRLIPVIYSEGFDSLFTGSSNGCVCIPEDQLSPLQKTIENGSAVYFYCPSSWQR